MTRIITLCTLCLFLSVSSAYATSQALVNVNGLVCDFCARSLEKMFGKQEEVAGIHVDLNKKIVVVDFKKGETLNDQKITSLITDAGYTVVDIRRQEEGEHHASH